MDLERQKVPIVTALTEADFKEKPSEMREYKVGDSISRENFVSFLITSFALSRGKPGIQMLFFRWVERKYNFDVTATLNSVVKAGGWASFSDEEKEKFLGTFRRVKKHTDKWLDFEHEDEILNEIEALVKRDNSWQLAEESIDIGEIETLQDFTQKVAQFLEDHQSKKNSAANPFPDSQKLEF